MQEPRAGHLRDMARPTIPSTHRNTFESAISLLKCGIDGTFHIVQPQVFSLLHCRDRFPPEGA
jgi:hypothetical protein